MNWKTKIYLYILWFHKKRKFTKIILILKKSTFESNSLVNFSKYIYIYIFTSKTIKLNANNKINQNYHLFRTKNIITDSKKLMQSNIPKWNHTE